MPQTIMEPSYYSQFSCIASACRTTCCAGWKITFEKKDYDKLRALRASAAMREKLRQSTRRYKEPDSPFYAHIVQKEDGSCPLLCDGLCQLQRECGAEYLPEICQNYPRQSYRISDLLLRACNNSCEAVHMHLLAEKQGMSLVHRPATPAEEKQMKNQLGLFRGNPIYPVYDSVLLTLLAIMQNRAYSLGDRLLLVGMAVRELDTVLAEDRAQDIPAWTRKFSAMATGDAFAAALAQQPTNPVLAVQNCMGNLFGVQESTLQPWAQIGDLPKRLGVAILDNKEGDRTVQVAQVDISRLERQTAHLDDLLREHPFYIEGVVINQMLSMHFPLLFSRKSEGTLYDDFLNLCNCYAMMRVGMIAYAGEDGSLEDVVDGAVRVARTLEHNLKGMVALVKQLHETGTDTLAHMSYLIRI